MCSGIRPSPARRPGEPGRSAARRGAVRCRQCCRMTCWSPDAPVVSAHFDGRVPTQGDLSCFSKVDYVTWSMYRTWPARSPSNRDTLGLVLKFESPGGVSSRPGQQRCATMQPANGARARRGWTRCRTGLGRVLGSRASIRRMLSPGTRCTLRGATDGSGGRTAFGSRCVDPDGLAISFAAPIGSRRRVANRCAPN